MQNLYIYRFIQIKKSNVSAQDFYFFDRIDPSYSNESKMVLNDIEKKYEQNNDNYCVHFFDLIKQHRENFVRITQITIYFTNENLQRIIDAE